MAFKFLDEALDSFQRGKYNVCRSILERGSDGDGRNSAATQWLVENNLVVCSWKELLKDEQMNHGLIIERLQKMSHIMQGLPPSLKCLSVEMTVCFNISALVLHDMCVQEPSQIDSAQRQLSSSTVDDIENNISTSMKRALTALGVTAPLQANFETILRSAADATCFAPTDIIRLVSLQTCLLALGHMITGHHQKAIDILSIILSIIPNKKLQQKMTYTTSPALIMTLQAGAFSVDMNRLKDEPTSPDANDLAQFLKSVCLFQTGQWKACLDSISSSQLALPCQLIQTLTLIQAYSFYQMGDFSSAQKFSESLSDSPKCEVQTKLKALNLTGCCLASLNKPYTAIQTFQEALHTDFGYLCPLYNISLVYRQLALAEAETDALDLLIQALRRQYRQGSTDVLSGSVDMILTPFPVSASQDHYGRYDITECSHNIVFVMHTLAQRLNELGRHNESVARYKDLLRMLEEGFPQQQFHTSRCGASRCLPSFQDLYFESTLAMYEAGDYEEVLSLTEKILSKMAPWIGSKGEKLDLTPYGSEGNCLSSSRSNSASSSLLEGDNRPQHWSYPRLLVANSLLLKCSCLMQSGNLTLAMETITDLLKYLNTVTRMVSDEVGGLKREAKQEMEEEKAPRSKRRKFDNDSTNETVTDTAPHPRIPQPIGKSLLEAKAKAYCNKSTLLIGLGIDPEALHMLLLAIQCAPDNRDIKHNHALLLRKMGCKEKC